MCRESGVQVASSTSTAALWQFRTEGEESPAYQGERGQHQTKERN